MNVHHTKSASEATTIDGGTTPPRLYYVQSPSQHDHNEKMSSSSTPPFGSPTHQSFHHQYHCSPLHHSRESATSRFSDSFKTHRNGARAHWKKLGSSDNNEGFSETATLFHPAKFYAFCFVFSIAVAFSVFSLILWAVAAAYAPKVSVMGTVFESFNVQAGTDGTGVPTQLVSLNSTVRLLYRNPASFFGVHVTSSPFELYHYQLKIASGFMGEFYAARKKNRTVRVVVQASQVAVYGGVSLMGSMDNTAVLPLNLTAVMRSRGFVLGRVVKPKFYVKIRCSVLFRGNGIGVYNDLTSSCSYL